MGLYDYIRCEMPLPEPWPVDLFQTKFADWPGLDRYVITADGRLIQKAFRYAGEAEEGRHPPTDTEISFHGDLEFHDLRDGEGGSLIARFTEGRCVRIWLDERETVFPPSQPDPAGSSEGER